MTFTSKQLINLAEKYETKSLEALNKFGQQTAKPDANWITALQKYLMANGFYPADGIMGPLTSAALKNWQEKNSNDPWIKVNGQLDPATIQALHPYLLKYM